MFCITDGKKFIKQDIKGKYAVVNNFNLADTWDKYDVAKAILNNSVSKPLRKLMYIAKCDNGEIIKYSFCKNEKDIQKENKENLSFKLDLYSFENDNEFQNIIKGFEMINPVLKDAGKMCLGLQQELIRLDYALEDLKHYQLKKKLGTVDSYKFKKISDKIVLRRLSVKNQLEVLHKINQYQSKLQTEVNDICNIINDIKNRTYKPRVLVDLFENNNLDIGVI